MSVDANRLPGRFILTGSANLLRMPDLPDSLAGRIEIMRLGPLTQLEMSQCVEGTTLLERIFQPEKLKAARVDRLGEDLIDRVLAGGFPAAVARTSHARRALWLRNYIETLVEKDIRELFSMQRPDVIFPLLESAAGRTARLYTGTTTHIQILTCHKIACRAAKKQESMVHILNRAESANGCSTGESRFLLTAFVNDSPEIISQYRTG